MVTSDIKAKKALLYMYVCVGRDLKHGYLQQQGKKGPYLLGGTLNMVTSDIKAKKGLTCMCWEGPHGLHPTSGQQRALLGEN